MQKFLARPVSRNVFPLIKKRPTIGGALMLTWAIMLYGIIIAIWWTRLRDYFVERGAEGGVFTGGTRLAAVALTGHFCDVTMGMVLIPISRHSALASFFQLSVSTTLTLHLITAYTLFTLVTIHGLLYASWIPVFQSLSEGLRYVYPVLNPTYLYNETWPGNASSLGLWRASLIFTGIVAATIMSIIFITTLPPVRSKHFNLFYFTHFLAIVMVIIICLHASTMFYCTAPGLAMWCLDWGMRVYELRRALNGQITTIGNGWYCVSVPLPRQRLSGCSCRSPLAHFYIHHSDSSIRELHPFTTITHLASQNAITPATQDSFPIQFLFRKRGKKSATAPTTISSNQKSSNASWLSRFLRTKRERMESVQWTNKLASLVDQHALEVVRSPRPKDDSMRPQASKSLSSTSIHRQAFPSIDVALRLEGPYFSAADPSRYGTVVCLVAGTGVSGAIAIAGAFTEMRAAQNSALAECSKALVDAPIMVWKRLLVVWSVRADEYVDLPFFTGCSDGLEFQKHLTGEGRPRPDPRVILENARDAAPKDKMWVYISGPKGFLEASQKICEAMPGVEYFAASWDP